MKRLLIALLPPACGALFAGSAFAQAKPEDATSSTAKVSGKPYHDKYRNK